MIPSHVTVFSVLPDHPEGVLFPTPAEGAIFSGRSRPHFSGPGGGGRGDLPGRNGDHGELDRAGESDTESVHGPW